MSEQLANLYSSTLAGSYTSGSGSISVSSASGAPATGTFSLTILDQTTGAVKLIYRVASVSGTTFTGAAEGADANASSGDIVIGTMLTAASLQQLFLDNTPPALVQSKAERGASTLTFNFASTAEDILVVAVGWENGAATASSLSDSAGTSYTKACEQTGSLENLAFFVGTVPSSPGTITFTATLPSGAGFQGISALEFGPSGISTTVDVTTVSSSPITITPTTVDVVVIANQGSSNGGVVAFPPNFIGISAAGSDSGGIAYSIGHPPVGVPSNATLLNSSGSSAYAAVGLAI